MRHLISLTLASVTLSLTSPLAVAQDTDPALVHKIVELTNAARRANGLPELRVSGFLQQSAQSHSDDQSRRNYIGHNSPEGMRPEDRILAVGYEPQTYMGENLYNGYGSPQFTSPEAAVQWWLGSPGHRANILSSNYTEIGVGLAITTASGMHIYTQNFGGASVTAPEGWGAIAYSAAMALAGTSQGKEASADALSSAMAQCTGAAQDCTLALSYRRGCGVVKRDPATGAWGAGLAGGHGMPAINAAGMIARQRCLAAGGSECNELVVATCSR